MKAKLFALLLAALLPMGVLADIYQDPKTMVNYEYTPGESEASVAAGIDSEAGSPDATGDITILSSFTVNGNDYTVTSIGKQAFAGCSGMTAVTIPESVTSIEMDAFSHCSGLTAITIPNAVTSIREYVFAYCTGLTSVTIGNSVTSIGYNAFRSCSGLTAVTIPESVTSIGWGAFRECSSLTTVVIPESVTSIETNAFYGCSSLTTVNIPEAVTSIAEYTFYGCKSLTAITIPEAVTSIGAYAFYACNQLTTVNIPEAVTSIGTSAFSHTPWYNSWYDTMDDGPVYYENILWGYKGEMTTGDIEIKEGTRIIVESAFHECTGLTSVAIPNSVTNIGTKAFSGCSSLTAVTIGNSVTSIERQTFADCSSLSAITIGNSVTDIDDNAFSGCNAITSITFHCENIRGWFKGQTSIQTIIIGDEVTSIAIYAFNGCSGLTSVTIGNSVTSIGSWAFMDCSSLTSITIPNSVTSLGKRNTFYGCTALTEVHSLIMEPFAYSKSCWNKVNNEIPLYVPKGTKALYEATEGWNYFTNIIEMGDEGPIGNIKFADENVKATCVENWDTDGDGELSYKEAAAVTDLGDAFQYNGDITSFNELQFFTGLTTIGEYTFQYCSGLTAVTIPKSVTTIGKYAFQYCSGFTAVTIPNSVTSMGDGAFDSCSSLTSIKVVAGNTVYDSRDNCNAIIETETNKLLLGCKNTVIPNSVTSIAYYAFENCNGLTAVTIPNSVTSIGNYAFQGCTGLTAVTIPNSVTSIGNNPFRGCNGLTEIKVEEGNTVYDSRDNCNAIIETETNGLISGCMNTVIPNSVTRIEYGAFEGCSGLTTVTIPNSVTKIINRTFYGCSGLTEVRSLIAEPFAINSECWAGVNNEIPLYVPIGTKALYEATAGWNYFTNIVETDGLEADDDGEKDFGEGGNITEDTDLSGVVVDNMFYNIDTDAGGYNSEEGCIVITKETSDEQMELLQGLGISDEELQQNFTGIIFKVPAGEGTVKVTAETTGNMTLKVKVGNGKVVEMELSGKLKMKFPYEVSEESLVYIFAGTTDESGVRGAAATEPSSLKIYGIEWSSSSPKGDVNGDGKVNVGDIMAVINVMAGVGGEAEKAAADVNGDGKVNVGDIMAVINIMAGK